MKLSLCCSVLQTSDIQHHHLNLLVSFSLKCVCLTQMQQGPLPHNLSMSWTCSDLPGLSTIWGSTPCWSEDVLGVISSTASCGVLSAEDSSALLIVDARLGPVSPLLSLPMPSTSLSRRALHLAKFGEFFIVFLTSCQKTFFSASSSSLFFYRKRNSTTLNFKSQKKKACQQLDEQSAGVFMSAISSWVYARLHNPGTIKNNDHPLNQLLYNCLKG